MSPLPVSSRSPRVTTSGSPWSLSSIRSVSPARSMTSRRNCRSAGLPPMLVCEYCAPASICTTPGATVYVLAETLGRSGWIRSDSAAAATDTPTAVATQTTRPHAESVRRSTLRVAPPELLPELRLLPAGLPKPLPLLVEMRIREQDRNHLLAPAVPEPEPPRGRRARASLGLEKRGPRHAPDARELRALRAAMIVDTEVEVPGARVDGQVTVEHGHLRRRGELDLVRGALDQGPHGDVGPVLGEELNEQRLDRVARDGHVVILGRGPVEAALDRWGRSLAHARLPLVCPVSILLQVEDHGQPDPQRAGREALGERLGREASGGFEGRFVEQRVRRRARDRDVADGPVGPNEDVQGHGAAEASTSCWLRVPDRFHEATPHLGQVASVFGSRRAARRAARRNRCASASAGSARPGRRTRL